MQIPVYQVDAFAEKVFSGNPAAVCPLTHWPDDGLMQQIAMENNLAETAFLVKEPEGYRIRWFTPAVEVDLCGHATLAAAHVLFHHLGYAEPDVVFHSRSGELRVRREGELLTLNFPVDVPQQVELEPALCLPFGATPLEAWKGRTDYLLLFDSEETIAALRPDMPALARLPGRGVIVTAHGNTADFVSRFFAPQSGIDEDPVTGSAHTTLAPFWAARLNKTHFKAMQISSRMGHLNVTLADDRVHISGKAFTYLTGTISV